MNLHINEVFHMKRTYLLSIIFSLAVALSGCGGGGGGGTSQPGAVVTLTTSGAIPPGNSIKNIDVTVVLPAGLSVAYAPSAANPAEMEPVAGVVALQGVAVGSQPTAKYTPATRELRIIVINATGFSTGAFATINCDGTTTQPATFVLTPNAAISPTGVADGNTPLPTVAVTASAVFH
jgi:hypothetical protein